MNVLAKQIILIVLKGSIEASILLPSSMVGSPQDQQIIAVGRATSRKVQQVLMTENCASSSLGAPGMQNNFTHERIGDRENKVHTRKY